MVPFERMDQPQLIIIIQGCSDQIGVADAHFLVLVVEIMFTSLKHFCLLVLISVVTD